MLLGVHARLGTYTQLVRPDTRGDLAWRISLWGQLLLVFHGFALLGAGAVISVIGDTHVFVHQDLEIHENYGGRISSSRSAAGAAGGARSCDAGWDVVGGGMGVLVTGVVGFRSGSRWLWWSSLIAGVIAYAAAIGVHYAVGYLSVNHLLPAFGGLV